VPDGANLNVLDAREFAIVVRPQTVSIDAVLYPPLIQRGRLFSGHASTDSSLGKFDERLNRLGELSVWTVWRGRWGLARSNCAVIVRKISALHRAGHENYAFPDDDGDPNTPDHDLPLCDGDGDGLAFEVVAA